MQNSVTTSSPTNPAQGTWPLFVRKFIVDFIETALATILTLTIAFPTSFTALQQVAITIGAAIASALVSAVRREAPDFIIWLKTKLGTN